MQFQRLLDTNRSHAQSFFTSNLCPCHRATPLQSEQACFQPSLDRGPLGTTPTGDTCTADSEKHSTLGLWNVFNLDVCFSLCSGVCHFFCNTYPAGYNHRKRLDETLDCHQFVEPEDFTGAHIEASLRHHTCRLTHRRTQIVFILFSASILVKVRRTVFIWGLKSYFLKTHFPLSPGNSPGGRAAGS